MIEETVLRFYRKGEVDPNHRFRSWEHCFTYFRRHVAMQSEEHADLAALNLAFYLASWGMYRGSSPLLWKDYRVHLPAVATLHSGPFDALWNFDVANASNDVITAETVVSLSTALKAVYTDKIQAVDGEPRQFRPTDTLISKILLGTFACTPACDRYFIFGLQNAGFAYSRLNVPFLTYVFGFYRAHQKEFSSVRDFICSHGGMSYPAMKLVDMYFWTVGWDLLSATDTEPL